MSNSVPIGWKIAPPQILVLGDSPFSFVLARILPAEQIAPEELCGGPVVDHSGGFPRVLDSLKNVWIVQSEKQQSGSMLRDHDAVWSWVEALSFDGAEHPLTFTFVLSVSGAANSAEALDVALGLSELDRSEHGYAFISMDLSLSELLSQTAKLKPQDRVTLSNRIKSDERHVVIQRLRAAVSTSEQIGKELEAAAGEIKEVFQEEEYLLDSFCREPAHRNGNRLRELMNDIVTNGVTPSDYRQNASEINEILK